MTIRNRRGKPLALPDFTPVPRQHSRHDGRTPCHPAAGKVGTTFPVRGRADTEAREASR